MFKCGPTNATERAFEVMFNNSVVFEVCAGGNIV